MCVAREPKRGGILRCAISCALLLYLFGNYISVFVIFGRREVERRDMIINFATCDRKRALEFIQKVYPSKTITDTPESAGPLLDFVEKDIVRIQDPIMYGNRIEVIPSKNWDEGMRDLVVKACKVFAG